MPPPIRGGTRERLISAEPGPGPGPGSWSWSCPSYLGVSLVAVLNAAPARHEKPVTVEHRIAAAGDADAHAGRTLQGPA